MAVVHHLGFSKFEILSLTLFTFGFCVFVQNFAKIGPIRCRADLCKKAMFSIMASVRHLEF